MSLLTYYLEYGSHLARLRRRRRRRGRRRACAPMSNTASHDNYKEINSWVTFSFLYEYGAPLGVPTGRLSSAITRHRAGTYSREMKHQPNHSMYTHNKLRISMSLEHLSILLTHYGACYRHA